MSIRKILTKELLIFLDQQDLKDLTKEEVDFIAKNIAVVVIKVVPVKKQVKLKLVKTG